MRRKMRKFIIILAAAAILLTVCLLLMRGGLHSNLTAYGEARLKNLALNIMNTAVTDVLAEHGSIKDVLKIEKDSTGHITLLTVDSNIMNDISVDAALTAGRRISELSEDKVSIPLGNLLGSNLFSGYGPRIPIRFQPLGAVSTSFYTELEEAGINQASYRVYIVLKCYMQMVVGQSKHTVEVSTQVLISEAIVVGVVPNTYANIPSETDFMNLIP